MSIIKTQDPNVSIYLLPWYIEGDMTRFEIGVNLYERLINDPDNTFVSVAVDDNNVKAVLIAYVRDNDVFIWQAKAKPGFKGTREMFDDLIVWAKNKKKDRLATHSPRNKCVMRRWGFAGSDNNEIIKEI